MINYKNLVFIISIVTTLLIQACSSGQKLLEKGAYDRAVYSAVDRLKSNSTNKKAINTLREAYDLATNRHLQRIKELKLVTTSFKWEAIAEEYSALNNLATIIGNCPACMKVVPSTKKYITELDDARYYAAEDRYNEGKKTLAIGTREAARNAYEHFDQADKLFFGFKDVKKQLDDAYWAAVLKVVVEPVRVNSNLYKLSNDYFQNKIHEFMFQYEDRSFIKFYSPAEAQKAKIKPHQFLYLSFDDFIVGQTYVKEKVQEVKKDSVKIGETRLKQAIYGTVKAQLITFEKSITSSGLLDLTIVDAATGRLLSQEKMPGTFVWLDSWGTYKGDDRALTREEIILCNRKETMPPPPQALFLEFTKPIYNQVVAKINTFYKRY
jgi:hypothetical protein